MNTLSLIIFISVFQQTEDFGTDCGGKLRPVCYLLVFINSFTGIQPCLLSYVLSTAALTLQWQNAITMTETTWLQAENFYQLSLH